MKYFSKTSYAYQQNGHSDAKTYENDRVRHQILHACIVATLKDNEKSNQKNFYREIAIMLKVYQLLVDDKKNKLLCKTNPRDRVALKITVKEIFQ